MTVRRDMRYIQQFIISDDPYGNKLYEVYLTPCNLTVLSYDLGGALKLEEILEDECLMQVLNPYIYRRIEGT